MIDIDGNPVVQYVYTLGAAGERLSVAELDCTVAYTYDELYRLTSETITEGEKVTEYTYAYDSVGNRILKTKNGTETEYTYNELNQLVADSDNTYEYDLNGNLVRVIGEAQAALYTYDSENHLIRATVQSGNNVSVEEYEYDYAGNRTAKKSEGEYTKYLLDINGSLTYVLAEMDYNGTEKCFYTLGADLISQERNGRTYTYLYDGHGSVVGLMSEDGSVTDTYTYDAFGNLLKSTGRTQNNYRYCGEQFDSTTGMYYLRARYMDTSTGRFISQDSYAGNVYDPVSLHKYLYANSNPVMYTDPSGYMSLTGAVIASAVIGSLTSVFVTIGLNILKNLDTTGELKCDVSLSELIESMILGGVFGALGCIAMSCKIALLAFALGGLSAINGVISFVLGVINSNDGNYRTAIAYGFLSILNFANAGFLCGKANGFGTSGTVKSDFRVKLEQALKELDKSGIRPGQTQISESRIQQILENYNSSKAQSSIYTDSNNTKYIVEGHHTTVASKINGTGTSANMGQPTTQEPSTTNVYWWKEWYEFWKTVIEIIE